VTSARFGDGIRIGGSCYASVQVGKRAFQGIVVVSADTEGDVEIFFEGQGREPLAGFQRQAGWRKSERMPLRDFEPQPREARRCSLISWRSRAGRSRN